uniref:Ig-like domain-containing protein n=1 Tax=Ursus maritimus TaxID=29073 RepID=A0A452U322_URSMA
SEAEAEVLTCPLPPASQSPHSRSGLKLEQPALVVARLPLEPSATLTCKVDSSVRYIHWYRHQEGMVPRRLLYLDMSSSKVERDFPMNADKVNAEKGSDGYSCSLSVLKLRKSDEGVYYCAAWEEHMFGPGTILRVTDKSPDADISPKPTVFLPSIAEIKVQKAGTYLCLLEDFFPDIIKIDWQEKDDKKILTSQQGDTMKTKDTYMKFSWLTVAGASLDKEHKCIVKHESDRTKVNQEILFPSINKDVVTVSPLSSGSFSRNVCCHLSPISKSDPFKTTHETNKMLLLAILQLQLTNTSAYYTYVLLLLKSLVYSAIMAVCLLGRPALYGNGKSS